MRKHITSTAIPTYALKTEALAGMSASFERFCLAAGIESLTEMLEEDAVAACGARHERGESRKAHRWGRTKGKIGFHGGKVEIERPRACGARQGRVRPAELGERRQRRLARQMGDEPDADQRLDAAFQAFGPIARGRRSGVRRSGAVEVGDLPPLRGVVGGAHEGMDGNPA